MSLQLSNDDWILRTDALINSVTAQGLVLIDDFLSPFLAVQIISNAANPAWSGGGRVAQGVNIDDQVSYGNYQDLQLDNLNLLQFPLITPGSYQLYYLPLPRLENIRLRVWEFQGETIDTSISNLITQLSTNAVVQVDLTAIETQINYLKSLITELTEENKDKQPQSKAEQEQVFTFLS